MLFNSYLFIFIFLPAAIAACHIAPRVKPGRVAVLGAASLIFYASWDWRFLALLLGSVITNYRLGRLIQEATGREAPTRARRLLVAGVIINLVLLGIFKYSHFFISNVNAIAGTEYSLGQVILPLGISFFTFEQIGFLVDLQRRQAYQLDPLRYGVFVTFFPRLVAGPILRYGEIFPQLGRLADRDFPADLAVGISIFAVGLAKKAFLADGISAFVPAAFDAAAGDGHLDFFAAWGGALAYTMQLYFDFSGYSDMAIGAARCFGIRFPENFNSPYKSISIIDFWRRWHITLSRFLRDYLYIPLGGNRRGKLRRYANLMITMLLGGFWHGAAWTFLAWGGLHGLYLMANHAWIALADRVPPLQRLRASALWKPFAWALTFVAVVVAWVFFRAGSFQAGFVLLGAMVGTRGIELPLAVMDHFSTFVPLLSEWGVRTGGSGSQFAAAWAWITALSLIALLAPNTQEIFARFHPTLEHAPQPSRVAWRENTVSAVVTGALALLGIMSITHTSSFLYWQF